MQSPAFTEIGTLHSHRFAATSLLRSLLKAERPTHLSPCGAWARGGTTLHTLFAFPDAALLDARSLCVTAHH